MQICENFHCQHLIKIITFYKYFRGDSKLKCYLSSKTTEWTLSMKFFFYFKFQSFNPKIHNAYAWAVTGNIIILICPHAVSTLEIIELIHSMTKINWRLNSCLEINTCLAVSNANIWWLRSCIDRIIDIFKDLFRLFPSVEMKHITSSDKNCYFLKKGIILSHVSCSLSCLYPHSL